MQSGMKPSGGGAAAKENPQLRAAFKIIIVLATTVVALVAALVWRGRVPATEPDKRSFRFQATGEENLIRRKFPEVDFGAVYPDMSAADIDRLQRDSLALRYVYAPFTEFEPLPVAGMFVNVDAQGFRHGRDKAPWPPKKDDFVVFVFGGSTTFGFGLPDQQTLPSVLEGTLGGLFPGRKVRCYNFGRGYYFSTQERALFASLLERGFFPHLALFLDGLNDFVYHDGVPQFTPALHHFSAPDFPMLERREPSNEREQIAAVDQVIARYQRNVRLTEGMAAAFGVSVIFIGQPVPFLDFPMSDTSYPFRSTFAEHRLSGWGYKRFKEAGARGDFGKRFLWCGDAFAQADRILYVDSIHYSRRGVELLAKCITDRIREQKLVP